MITHGSLRVRYQNDIKLFEIFTVKDEMKKSFELEWYESCLLLLWMETEPELLRFEFFFLSGDPQNIIMWHMQTNNITYVAAKS